MGEAYSDIIIALYTFLFSCQVSRMKKELLLMGEVQVKYEEKLAALKYDNQMTLVLPEQEQIYLKDISS